MTTDMFLKHRRAAMSDNLGLPPRETLTKPMVEERVRWRKPYRTAQEFGMYLVPGLYVIGSSPESNDDSQPHFLAALSASDEWLQLYPLANMVELRSRLGEPTC